MTIEARLKFPCGRCSGTLVVDHGSGPVDCPCVAGGKPGWDLCETIDIGSNIFPSYEILEQLDPTEHNALTDTQKDGVLHLLACGKVDLNTGKAGRVRLWSWFGAESTTVANLTAIIE